MATTKISLFLLAMFIALSLSSVGMVQASNRKLLAPTFPDFGDINPGGGGFDFPPFPPVTDWPEYRLPSPLFSFPDIPSIPSGSSYFSPPAQTTTDTTTTTTTP
ncbi:hypothetical protein PIB30_005549 [Stylosanthes scabra]|uniref:Uncharacterized protein n=1 Tax=Stylosanthes scabra TaxID=79078 RepID=A0ABU6Q430_9FABA|nr:hypothetical protein [Stylosanthes scabra]